MRAAECRDLVDTAVQHDIDGLSVEVFYGAVYPACAAERQSVHERAADGYGIREARSCRCTGGSLSPN